MKRGTASTISVLLLTAIMVIFWSPPSIHPFWFGDKITPEHMDEVISQDLHDFIVNNILTNEFNQSLRGVDNNPDEITGLRIYEQEKCWEGYTLLSSLGGHADPNNPRIIYNTILIDMDGNLVREWYLNATPAKMLPGGYVIGGKPEIPVGRGLPTLQQLDWCGSEVWKYDPRPEIPVGADWHHDFQRERNPVGYYAPGLKMETDKGKTLILSHGYPGVVDDISTYPLLDDKIYEIDWEGNVLWEWHAYEHFDQDGGDLGMGFHDQAKDAIMNISVGRPLTDWQHMNSASYIGPNKWYNNGDLRFHPDNIIWDGRTSNIIAIIARNDHPDGLWESGDIVWRVGPHYSSSFEEHELGQIIGQHMAHMIPRGLPGAGNILVFDNGGIAGFDSFLPGMPGYYPATYRNYSRVIEFNPVTLEMVWEYKDTVQEGDINGDGEVKGEERKFYSNLISGAQRLQNGNTLICEGHGGRIFEVTQRGEIVWEYISPYADGRTPPVTDPNAVYRAYRVPYWWVPEYLECPEP